MDIDVTILFIDIVEYSLMTSDTQSNLVQGLTQYLRQQIGEFLDPTTNLQKVIALPTGDGFALVVLSGAEVTWLREKILGLSVRLHIWSANNNAKLRVGVHHGPVKSFQDINGKTNVCGEAINTAQRIMDSANAKQTLLSEAAFNLLIENMDTYVMKDHPDHRLVTVRGKYEVFDKHDKSYCVHSLSVGGLEEIISTAEPTGKYGMRVPASPRRKESLDADVGAKNIAWVQLTGGLLLPKLREIPFHEELKKLWVFIPDPSTYPSGPSTTPLPDPVVANLAIKEWEVFLKGIRAKYKCAEVKLGIFTQAPYFGGKFIDWEYPNGLIYITPYIWNREASLSPGYEICMKGRGISDVYDAYVSGLTYLNAQTSNRLDSVV